MSTETTPAIPPALSERELEVLKLVATGATNGQVARDLAISINTVKVHLNNIFAKLGVQSRTEASLYAVRHGWIEVKWADGTSSSGAPAAAAIPASIANADIASGSASSAPANGASNGTAVAAIAAAPVRQAGWRWPALAVGIAILSAVLLILFAPGMPFGNNLFSQSPQVTAPPLPAATAIPRWQLRSPLSAPREAIAVTTLNGRIYVMGGLEAGAAVSTVEVYDPPTDAWSARAPLPNAVQGGGAAVIAGKIYVPGGCDAQDRPSNSMQVYDPQRDSWEAGVALPQAVCHYAVATLEGKLYVFGGWDGTWAVADVRVFDPVRGEWSSRAPLPSPRMGAAAAVVEDRIYVAGGRDGNRLLDELLLFDATQPPTSAKAWSAQPKLDHPRAELALAALAGNLYVVSGGWSATLAQNGRFDTRLGSWQAIEADPEGLWRAGGVAALETKIYVIGGRKANSLTASVAEYTALYRSFLPNAPGPP